MILAVAGDNVVDALLGGMGAVFEAEREGETLVALRRKTVVKTPLHQIERRDEQQHVVSSAGKNLKDRLGNRFSLASSATMNNGTSGAL
jgi:hypothetical protein